MWFTIFYTPSRATGAPLQMKGRFYGDLSGAGMALGLLRRGHRMANSGEGWYLRNDSTGQWVQA